jgi:hypothetical protein
MNQTTRVQRPRQEHDALLSLGKTFRLLQDHGENQLVEVSLKKFQNLCLFVCLFILFELTFGAWAVRIPEKRMMPGRGKWGRGRVVGVAWVFVLQEVKNRGGG